LDVDIEDRFAHAVKFALDDDSRTHRVVEPSATTTAVGRLPGVRPSSVRRAFLAAAGFAVAIAAVAFGLETRRSKVTRKTGAKGRRSAPVCSCLEQGSRVSGKLNFEGAARIDGQIDGEIVAKDSILIGESAAVTAQIRAASIVVAGEVKGEITASQSIELRPSAKVLGKLIAPKLVVHEGARRFDLGAAVSDKLIARPRAGGN
jgi:cytoskeletal protein CcmA (bactofilin family)